MHLSNEIFTASTTSIECTGSHLFWTDSIQESLQKSIMEFGQSAPVLTCESEKGLTLIAGMARLTVQTALGNPVLARMVEDVSPVEMGLLYLADNGHRVLDDGMRLKALKYFAPFMDCRTVKADILPRLGIKPKSKDAKLLLTWLDMPEQWQALLESGNIPLASATPLKRMSQEDLRHVEPLFTGFSWSRSNAINVLNWLFETSRMIDAPVQVVMKQAGITEILQLGLSPKDAIARISTAARLARYPELSALQTTFATAAGEITTGTRWRMHQPNSFETGGSELIVQVKNTAQLKQAVEELTSMAEAPAWKKIWNLGGGND
ncbi:hypothetical protein [Pseudodesulfovibrio sediminis]|uniref:Uncharacterized protein n=1 Tax=Pseudodesulfovibrio sediminis TaxID=2810563 RepID=A0ABM7P1W2_9BACT|nr:hypothetical protein [Pseudodesulfovibrio sediminis]BCS86771.1 hypothetical protein PSDVSF_00130 [Pseudodesulfovibrio sediminis]